MRQKEERKYGKWQKDCGMKQLTEKKNKWINPNIAPLAGMAGVKKAKGLESVNITRKYKNIAIETAWVLWKVRNERAISKKEMKKEQVKERWKKTMKRMIEEIGRINQKDSKRQKEEGKGNFLKAWAMTNLVMKRKEKRIKVKE